LVGDEKDLILDCYRLARHYHQAPDVFLNMPLDEVQLHLSRTIELAEIMRRQQQAADSDDA
jgi:hypothetical protein